MKLNFKTVVLTSVSTFLAVTCYIIFAIDSKEIKDSEEITFKKKKYDNKNRRRPFEKKLFRNRSNHRRKGKKELYKQNKKIKLPIKDSSLLQDLERLKKILSILKEKADDNLSKKVLKILGKFEKRAKNNFRFLLTLVKIFKECKNPALKSALSIPLGGCKDETALRALLIEMELEKNWNVKESILFALSKVREGKEIYMASKMYVYPNISDAITFHKIKEEYVRYGLAKILKESCNRYKISSKEENFIYTFKIALRYSLCYPEIYEAYLYVIQNHKFSDVRNSFTESLLRGIDHIPKNERKRVLKSIIDCSEYDDSVRKGFTFYFNDIPGKVVTDYLLEKIKSPEIKVKRWAVRIFSERNCNIFSQGYRKHINKLINLMKYDQDKIIRWEIACRIGTYKIFKISLNKKLRKKVEKSLVYVIKNDIDEDVRLGALDSLYSLEDEKFDKISIFRNVYETDTSDKVRKRAKRYLDAVRKD